MTSSSRQFSRLDGVLLQAPGEIFGDKVYFCRNGRRHWAMSAEHIHGLGARWPDDVVQVPEDVLRAFTVGGHVPLVTDAAVDPERLKSSVLMREYMASPIRGRGLEFGAGASPYPVPLGCDVIYGDRFSYEEIVEHMYPGQSAVDLVRPDAVVDFDQFDGIQDETLDFIVACHVIEHLRDPLGAIANAYAKLKPGGYLLLVVPDKTRTFDRERPLTSLEHLVEDFRRTSPEADYGHYEEFYRLAFKQPDERYRAVVDEKFRERGDIHYHVWDYRSFSKMIDYFNASICQWKSVWSHRTLDDQRSDIEFYFRLCK